MSPGGRDRRRHPRWTLGLPVRVQVRGADGEVHEEMTSCQDASAGGVSLRLGLEIRQGQVLFLSLPLPSRFRQYDLTAQSYRVYALVRSVVPVPGAPARVGVLFYGRKPPQGTESLPAGLFLLEGDSQPGSGAAGSGVRLILRLGAQHAPGGVAQQEETAVERLIEGGVRVKVRSLPVMKEMSLEVEELGGGFESRATVEQIVIGTDGDPRVDIAFLEAAPERWRSGAETA